MRKISGMTLEKPYFDFIAGEEKAKSMSFSELIYSIKDALKSAEAMKGHNSEAENWYRDEAMTYQKELNERKKVAMNYKKKIYAKMNKRAEEENKDLCKRCKENIADWDGLCSECHEERAKK